MTPDSGWAIHGTPSTGAIMSTTNGGTNWIIEQGANNWYQSISVFNRSKAWVASSDGIVWYSLLNSINEIHQKNEIAGMFDLVQNYPNPFNPVTVIKYNLPSKEYVKLVVYDITGNTVSILINGEQTRGLHSVEFDGNNIASGIYFYTLSAGEYRTTKKMILLK